MLLLKTIEIKGREMKRILIFIFVIEVLFGVDLRVENNISDNQNRSSKQPYFAKRLFQGNFKENRQIKYSPNYRITVGDTISLKLWGAYEYASESTVDTKGNIFIPKVGKINLLGIANHSLKDRVSSAVRKVFNQNVSVYATLNSYQPISIFVTGGVEHPGIYEGLSSDSVLQFIDKASGIIDGQGSYREVMVLRDNQIIKKFDLYEFLLDGTIGLFQFKNGDVIRVSNLKNHIEIAGEINFPSIFELSSQKVVLNDITQFVLPQPTVTHFMITRWIGGREKVEKYPISDMGRVMVQSGEKVYFLSDYLKDNLTINVAGEHDSLHIMTVNKGDNMEKILSKIKLTPQSDIGSIGLYRKSIAQKQKQLIDANLRDLEARVLTTGSSTVEEAKIRKEESSLVLSFISRASKVNPKGQVIINSSTDLSEIILEDYDTIFIPKKSQIIVVEGEVSLPNAQTFIPSYRIEDYIKSCGGYSPRANNEKVLLIKKNGRVVTYNASSWWGGGALAVEPGDSILILGKVDSKNIQITASVTEIIYQIAISAAVVLRAF